MLTFSISGNIFYAYHHNLHYTKYMRDSAGSLRPQVLESTWLFTSKYLKFQPFFSHVHLYISTALLETKTFLFSWSWVTPWGDYTLWLPFLFLQLSGPFLQVNQVAPLHVKIWLCNTWKLKLIVRKSPPSIGLLLTSVYVAQQILRWTFLAP